MTEAEWVHASEGEIWKAVAALGLRRTRLLGVALVRTLPGADKTVVQKAMATAELFADGRKRKDSLRQSWDSLRSAKTEIASKYWNYGEALDNEPRLQAVVVAEAVCSVHSLGLIVDYTVRAHSKSDDSRNAVARQVVYPLFREISGPAPVPALPKEWRTSTAVALAAQMYESRDFGAMPILADALQDAGCDSADVLDHCRGPGPHVRGCWVVDLVLGEE